MPGPESWTFEAIGTRWSIETATALSAAVREAVTARIDEFDRTWSRFRDDSLVSQMAARAGTWEMPEEAEALLGLYAALDRATGGAVNPLVGRTLADLGYDAAYSFDPRPDPAEVPGYASTLTLAGQRTLRTCEPVVLDVGAAGKGLLVDLVAAVVTPHHAAFTIDASGDLLHTGPAPLRVALEHPDDPTLAIGVAEIEPGRGLCASATNRRAWGDGLHHVIDARTGLPTRDVVATWVVADSCLLADGLATACFFADTAALAGVGSHEYVRLLADGRAEWSPGFPGEVFT